MAVVVVAVKLVPHFASHLDQECPRPPRYRGAVWRYDHPDSGLTALYRCLAGYRHMSGSLNKTCDNETRQWVDGQDIVCSGITHPCSLPRFN